MNELNITKDVNITQDVNNNETGKMANLISDLPTLNDGNSIGDGTNIDTVNIEELLAEFSLLVGDINAPDLQTISTHFIGLSSLITSEFGLFCLYVLYKYKITYSEELSRIKGDHTNQILQTLRRLEKLNICTTNLNDVCCDASRDCELFNNKKHHHEVDCNNQIKCKNIKNNIRKIMKQITPKTNGKVSFYGLSNQGRYITKILMPRIKQFITPQVQNKIKQRNKIFDEKADNFLRVFEFHEKNKQEIGFITEEAAAFWIATEITIDNGTFDNYKYGRLKVYENIYGKTTTKEKILEELPEKLKSLKKLKEKDPIRYDKIRNL